VDYLKRIKKNYTKISLKTEGYRRKVGEKKKKNNRPKYCRRLNDLKKTVATVDINSAVVWSSAGAKL
jgi:hypothetical protein